MSYINLSLTDKSFGTRLRYRMSQVDMNPDTNDATIALCDYLYLITPVFKYADYDVNELKMISKNLLSINKHITHIVIVMANKSGDLEGWDIHRDTSAIRLSALPEYVTLLSSFINKTSAPHTEILLFDDKHRVTHISYTNHYISISNKGVN